MPEVREAVVTAESFCTSTDEQIQKNAGTGLGLDHNLAKKIVQGYSLRVRVAYVAYLLWKKFFARSAFNADVECYYGYSSLEAW